MLMDEIQSDVLLDIFAKGCEIGDEDLFSYHCNCRPGDEPTEFTRVTKNFARCARLVCRRWMHLLDEVPLSNSQWFIHLPLPAKLDDKPVSSLEALTTALDSSRGCDLIISIRGYLDRGVMDHLVSFQKQIAAVKLLGTPHSLDFSLRVLNPSLCQLPRLAYFLIDGNFSVSAPASVRLLDSQAREAEEPISFAYVPNLDTLSISFDHLWLQKWPRGVSNLILTVRENLRPFLESLGSNIRLCSNLRSLQITRHKQNGARSLIYPHRLNFPKLLRLELFIQDIQGKMLVDCAQFSHLQEVSLHLSLGTDSLSADHPWGEYPSVPRSHESFPTLPCLASFHVYITSASPATLSVIQHFLHPSIKHFWLDVAEISYENHDDAFWRSLLDTLDMVHLQPESSVLNGMPYSLAWSILERMQVGLLANLSILTCHRWRDWTINPFTDSEPKVIDTKLLLPHLTSFNFYGMIHEMKHLLSHIEAPALEELIITICTHKIHEARTYRWTSSYQDNDPLAASFPSVRRIKHNILFHHTELDYKLIRDLLRATPGAMNASLTLRYDGDGNELPQNAPPDPILVRYFGKSTPNRAFLDPILPFAINAASQILQPWEDEELPLKELVSLSFTLNHPMGVFYQPLDQARSFLHDRLSEILASRQASGANLPVLKIGSI